VPGGQSARRGRTRLDATNPWLTADATPVHEARVLTEGGSLARIVLEDQIYTLRITRQGKLILTK
jgi:hemin uptake protein HemP